MLLFKCLTTVILFLEVELVNLELMMMVFEMRFFRVRVDAYDVTMQLFTWEFPFFCVYVPFGIRLKNNS